MMLQQILFGFKLVFPLFIIMSLGGLFRHRKLVTITGFRDLNFVLFNLFVPCNVFYAIATADRSRLFEPVFGLIIVAGLIITFGLGLIIVPKFVKDYDKHGVIVQSLVRGNFAVVSLSLLQQIYGQKGLELAGITLLISMPINNITSVIALEGMGSNHSSVKTLIANILKNPMIIATFLAILTFFIKIPEILLIPVKMLAQATGTVALFALGGLLDLKSIGSNKKILNSVTFIRLIFLPASAILLAYLLNQPERIAMALMVFFGAPVAIVTHAMVQKIGGDEELAGQLIVYTTAFSMISFAFWIGIVRHIFS